MYFKSESVETIANHILALYAGKVAAFSRADKRFEIRLDREGTGTFLSPTIYYSDQS